MSGAAYTTWVKPLIDRGSAWVLLALLSPLLIGIVIAIKLGSPGPVFYRQQRIGRDERRFDILKFRTMTVDPERVAAQTHGHSPGVTGVGRVLRRLKIDEMPQLLNVALGDMSLVGPRPCLPALLDAIEPWARARFSVTPGLTGLAQTNGNVHLSWPDRWRWDVHYVQRVSFALDARLLWRTLAVMLRGEGRYRRLPPP